MNNNHFNIDLQEIKKFNIIDYLIKLKQQYYAGIGNSEN